MEKAKIITLPKCRMVTSGLKGDQKKFNKMWMKLDKKRKDKFFPRDFMFFDEKTQKNVWLYALEEWVTEKDTEGFEIIDFKGGIYATGIAPQKPYEEGLKVFNVIKDWVNSGKAFALDRNEKRPDFWHVVGTSVTDKALGYRQIEIFVPIKLRKI
jgi:hypothetical protein